jgi:thiol:disulfide interchange protein DsbA
MTDKRQIANLVLPLVGIAIILYYSVCGNSCAYLKGAIFGLDLTYLGIGFAGLLFVLTLLRKELLRLFVLSAGIGTEVYLVGFQVKSGVYCPYCLLFAVVLIVLFVLNFRVARKIIIAIAVILGFLFFTLFFEGSTRPVLADNLLMPTFGNGKAKVRIYTDYFCGPCDKLEPKLESTLARLVRKNVASVTFVDTPIHAPTPMYARYFLYIINEQNDFDHVLRMRAILFEAARSNITQKEKLEEYLAKNQVKFKQLDAVPIFTALNKYLKDDAIDSTPTVVIQEGQNKGVYKGAPDILKALEGLK